MIYAENVLAALAAPLLFSVFLLTGEARRFNGFLVIGLCSSLLSSYVNGFVAAAAGMATEEAAVKLTPICEEAMKALPVLFYAMVFEPERRGIVTVSLACGLGFATLENVCYIMRFGADELVFALVRGASAGIMHAICAAIFGFMLAFAHNHRALALSGHIAALCAASIFHATYNLLVLADGFWQTAGFALPVVMSAVAVICAGHLGRRLHAGGM